MPFEYYDIEDLIVAALAGQASFETVPIPDSEADFKRPITKPRVTVAFAGGKNLGNTAVDVIRFEEEFTVICNIQSKTLRGPSGCHQVARIVTNLLNGVYFSGRQLQYTDYQPGDPLRDEKNNFWSWDLSFSTRRMKMQIAEQVEEQVTGSFESLNQHDEFQTDQQH